MNSIKTNFFLVPLFSAGVLLSIGSIFAASEFLSYATMLSGKSFINSNTEAGYRLDAPITRGELAKIAANIGDYKPTTCANSYKDVDKSLGDLCGYILALREAGVVVSGETYRPLAPVSRAEMVKILLGAAGEKGSAQAGPYRDITGYGDLSTYIIRAQEIGCARSAYAFRPAAPSSRGETFKIASCVLDYKARQVVKTTVSGEVSLMIQ